MAGKGIQHPQHQQDRLGTQDPYGHRHTNNDGLVFLSCQVRKRGQKMQTSLHVSGKRPGRSPVAMVAAGPEKTPLLFVWDCQSGRRLLVDTGAWISVYPPSGLDTRSSHYSTHLLRAANGTAIKSFSTRTIPLSINGRRFQWEFVIADVTQPILGADENNLAVDLKGQRLVNLTTYVLLNPPGVQERPSPRCLQCL